MAQTTDRLLVPIPDTCAQLGGVSRTTVYELVNNGQLVKVNIGRRGFITAESLNAYVASLSEPPQPAQRDKDSPCRRPSHISPHRAPRRKTQARNITQNPERNPL